MLFARRLMSTGRMSIKLSSAESDLISHLDAYAGRQVPPVICRIAGGWVRDKLLGLPSCDLDIALTIPSGHSFAVGFVDFLKTRNVATGSVGKVAANPEQSKHLETGTTRIMGLECDFVGLRSETYTDSRIPDQVQLGTPEEDAARRDLTINSLFYNVHSRQVEDYTRSGLSDLEKRIARTPLPPVQTFEDDPLRVLRCIRFASRFELTIAEEIVEAIKLPEVQSSLRNKVSKERVGIEVHKMMKHQPLRAITLIDELQLHSSIFTSDVEIPRHDSLRTAVVLDRVAESFGRPDEILWLATVVSPFRGLMSMSKKKEVPTVSLVLSDGLKLSTDIKTSVTNLFTAAGLLKPQFSSRSELGVVLQNPAVRPWSRSIMWAAVMEILPRFSEWNGECDSILRRYLALRDHIVESGLSVDIDKAPLLNGHELQSILDIRPSPLMNVIRRAVNEWQLSHPGHGKEECEAWLRRKWQGSGRAVWEAQVPVVDKPKAEKRKR